MATITRMWLPDSDYALTLVDATSTPAGLSVSFKDSNSGQATTILVPWHRIDYIEQEDVTSSTELSSLEDLKRVLDRASDDPPDE